MRAYERRDWKTAAAAFGRALKAKPGDAQTKKFFEEAQARAQARPEPLPPELRIKYARGLQFYQQGKYQEALDIWQEIRKEQPYNKGILDAIDRARDRLKNQ